MKKTTKNNIFEILVMITILLIGLLCTISLFSIDVKNVTAQAYPGPETETPYPGPIETTAAAPSITATPTRTDRPTATPYYSAATHTPIPTESAYPAPASPESGEPYPNTNETPTALNIVSFSAQSGMEKATLIFLAAMTIFLLMCILAYFYNLYIRRHQ